MIITPKNWLGFQHYKNRRPPWIKLYRSLLDDSEWNCLPDASKALAIMLWLLASDNEKGEINAASKPLAFRLRTTPAKINEALKPLIESGFFIASTTLADCLQDAIPEERRDRGETEAQAQDDNFETFWKAYPKKAAKAVALQEWKKAKINGEFDSLLTVLELQKASPDWLQENGKYIPHPAKWIKNKRWQDEIQKPVASVIPKGNYI